MELVLKIKREERKPTEFVTFINFALIVNDVFLGYVTNEVGSRELDGRCDWRLFDRFGNQMGDFLGYKEVFNPMPESEIVDIMNDKDILPKFFAEVQGNVPCYVELSSDLTDYYIYQDELGYYRLDEKPRKIYKRKEALEVIRKFTDNELGGDFRFRFEFETLHMIRPLKVSDLELLNE
jgi:hypothetical protein